MDATVFAQGRGFWHVNALPSMRSLGDLTQGSDRTFTVTPDEGSPLLGMAAGPYPSLETAMAAIAGHLDGQCTLARLRGRP